MNIEITILALIISGIAILIGVLRGENKDSEYLKMTGFVIILLLGILNIASPMTFNTGTNVTSQYTYTDGQVTSSSQQYVNTYTNESSLLSGGLSLALILLGLYGTIISAIAVSTHSENEHEKEEAEA